MARPHVARFDYDRLPPGELRSRAESHGLVVRVYRYGATGRETLMWLVRFEGRDVGHWIPLTGSYRAGTRYGRCNDPLCVLDVFGALVKGR